MSRIDSILVHVSDVFRLRSKVFRSIDENQQTYVCMNLSLSMKTNNQKP